MKITIVIATLRLGGAEHVAAMLANHLSESGHSVRVITRIENPDFYELNRNIERLKLRPIKASRTPVGAFIQNRYLVNRYRKEFISTKPDAIISFMNRTNIRVLMALDGLSIPVIISEHNYPPANPLSHLWEKLRRRLYPRADYLVSLSKGTDSFFDYMPMEKKRVINNPIDRFAVETVLPEGLDQNRKRFIAAGRLHPVKNFSSLIKAFTSISMSIPDWDLIILGEGEEKAALSELIVMNNLEGRIRLPGMVKNVHDYFRSSHIFCLTSFTEGFGNVIVEAMDCGLPVISTDCPTGPGEIIRNDSEGILVQVNDTDSLAKAMLELAKDNEKRNQLSENSIKRAQDFTLDSIMPQWDSLLESFS